MRLTREPDQQESRLQQLIQGKKPTFKDLTFKKKLEYIWDYHKWKIIIAAVVISIAASAVPSLIENSKEVALYAAFINTQLADQDDSPLLADFAEKKGIEMEHKRMRLDCSMIINYKNPDQFSMLSSQKLAAMFASNTPDVIVQDNDTYTRYAAMGVYADLEDVLGKEFLEKHKDLLVYADGQGDAGKHAYGIDISDSPILTEQKAYLVPAVYSICINANQKENSVKFLEYLMGE